jgi:alkylhydroperoxidase/carboxymuconolactone decarboxylase family protein YurZ
MPDSFQKEAPAVARAYEELTDALNITNGLDPKTKELVFIGIKASRGDTSGISHHVEIAKQLGATMAEIRDTILTTLSVCGSKETAGYLPMESEKLNMTQKMNEAESSGFNRINIGKITETRLLQSGIKSFEMLETLGSERAFILLTSLGSGQNLRLLYKLEGAIQGIKSGDLSEKRKQELTQFYNVIKKIKFPVNEGNLGKL